jgi:hypothetical protein
MGGSLVALVLKLSAFTLYLQLYIPFYPEGEIDTLIAKIQGMKNCTCEDCGPSGGEFLTFSVAVLPHMDGRLIGHEQDTEQWYKDK